MSRDAAAPRLRRRRVLRVVTITVLLAIAAIAATIYLLFPWYRVGDLEVASARVEPLHLIDGGNRPTDHAIVVDFSTDKDLRQLRSDIDIDFITAALSACKDRNDYTREVIVQGPDRLPDRGRVTARGRTPGPNGRYRYRAVFDDEIARFVDHQPVFSRALGVDGGLCFALDGASMWAGKLWSNRVPLALR